PQAASATCLLVLYALAHTWPIVRLQRGNPLETVERPKYQSPHKSKAVFLGEQSGGGLGWALGVGICDSMEWSGGGSLGNQFPPRPGFDCACQLRDTVGLERFCSLTPSYIHDSTIAVVVYDIRNINSFKETDKRVEHVWAERGDNVVIMLVGNKTDLNNKRGVSAEEGEEKSRDLNMMFIGTSAKTTYNVNNVIPISLHDTSIALLSLANHHCLLFWITLTCPIVGRG
ncbi:PREDICTED: ras-related protein Rab-41, partial [Ceratotherium simum simum]|uniref:Ras-related protein Rab-41 n=1 Tax=Ceratotherium simum simum TaxID=73337 RepID=A0ABM1DEX7_CERSS